MLVLLVGACAGPPATVAPTGNQQSRTSLTTNPDITLQTMAVGQFELQYAESGSVGKPTVVFIHGTPGSWRSLGRLLANPELQQQVRLVSIDRPGWGGSPLLDKDTEGSFAEQVKLIEPLLRRLKNESNDQPLILVGHSYGASISPYIAYMHPELVDGLLMASGAIDPVLGKPRWYNRAAAIWPISRMIDDRLVKANVEIWGVYDALKQLEPWWASVTIPMIYMQGEEDELVDPRNLDFAENFLPAPNTTVVRIPDQSHFVHRQQTELIAELALELLNKAEIAAAD
ncbi:MAG: alpha/beta hydrolase [Gammaproteobacteria bacterium]|nr:alpha/beta hydrolase [Gammaproteobacteria bacterium]MDP6731482.1 alpha/beta hydrolase [Gammaproteobacteria bacterium]